MITPENAAHLARARRARGGETWLPMPEAALYAALPANTLFGWARLGRVRKQAGCVDLGEVLEVRDRSTSRVPDAPLTYRVLGYYRLVANGWTAAEIAAEYGVTAYAVHRAVNDAAHALGARNRTHATALLVARGLISSAEVEGWSTDDPRQVAGKASA